MTGEDSSYQAYTARKASRLSRPNLDCGCPKGGAIYGHLWCDRLACRDHADDVHDCSAFGGAKSIDEERPRESASTAASAPPAPGEQTDEEFLQALDGEAFRAELHAALDEHASDLARLSAEPRFRCRGCRLWIAQDVKLCGPCSALPSCLAERFSAEWGGTVVCFRPDGHDGQHESVQGRCWMDAPSPFLMAAIDAERDAFVDRLAEAMTARVTVATPEEAAADTRTMETRSLECSRSRPMCSGCDGAAAWGSSPCLHECHEVSDAGVCCNRLTALFGEVFYCTRDESHAGEHRSGGTTWTEIEDKPAAPARRPWWKRWPW